VVQALLLDGLGTLLELEAPWPRLREDLREERGIELSETQAERAFRAEMSYYRAHHHEGRDQATLAELRGRCAAVLRRQLPPAVIGKLSAVELEPLMLKALHFRPYAEVPGVLSELRIRGLRLVVVSNWDVSLHEVLRVTGLMALLDGVITSAEVSAPKPAPAIFERALELAGVSAGRALHVGDSVSCDVAGALSAGIAPVLLCREQGGASLQDQPAVDTPVDLPVVASLEGLLAPGALQRA
jgi:putative hydrolase of the HAD superfamily